MVIKNDGAGNISLGWKTYNNRQLAILQRTDPDVSHIVISIIFVIYEGLTEEEKESTNYTVG